MLHPAEPSEVIPDEQLTLAVVAVTELLLPAVTVGFWVHDAAGVYVTEIAVICILPLEDPLVRPTVKVTLVPLTDMAVPDALLALLYFMVPLLDLL